MKSLMTALEEQQRLLEELRCLLKQETGELSEVHLDAMARINLQKEEISSRIEAHGAALRTAIQEVASREGLSSRAALGELAARLSQKGAARWLVFTQN